jgi:DNA mismatch repair ATPase MutL
MTLQHRLTSILGTCLLAALCSAPQLRAQQSNPSTAQQPPETSQQPQQPASAQPTTAQPSPTNQAQPDQTQPASQPQAPASNTQATPPASQNQPQQPAEGGTSVNPSQAPLQPVTTYPDATGAEQEQQPAGTAPQDVTPQTTTIPEAPQPKKQTEPVGAATAESVPTAGGAAAKPAGVAIAPAKQHQTRSLLIKVGAVLAAGAALGTVYALSHGTSSTPPGAGAVGVTGR